MFNPIIRHTIHAAILSAIIQSSVFGAILKFDQTIDAGLISYSQGPNSLEGKNLAFDLIELSNPSDLLLPTPLTCLDCSLNFKTGRYLGYQTINEFAGLAMFDAGGFFRLSGIAIDPLVNNAQIASGSLLDGIFERPLILSIANGLINFSGFGQGHGSEQLLGFYGLENPLQFSITFQSTLSSRIDNQLPSFISTIAEADIIARSSFANDPPIDAEVSEPKSFFLMLLGLVGILMINRNFFR